MAKLRDEDIWNPIVEQLVEALGGLDNIQRYLHCATRLRVEVADESKVSIEKLKEVQKGKGVVKEGDQFQVIFGTGIVNKVYKWFDDYYVANTNVGGPEGSSSVRNKPNKDAWWNSEFTFKANLYLGTRRSLKAFANIFLPCIPIFVAGGLSLAFASLIFNTGATDLSGGWGDTFYGVGMIFQTVGDAMIGMMPVFVAWSTIKQLGGSDVYGIGIGLVLVAPGLVNAWSAATAIQFALAPGNDKIGQIIDNGWAFIQSDGTLMINAQSILDSVAKGDVAEFAWLQDIVDSGATADGFISATDFVNGFNSAGIAGTGLVPIDFTLVEADITADVIIALNFGYSIQDLVGISVSHGESVINISGSASGLVGTYLYIFGNFAWGIFGISFIGYQAQIFAAILATVMVHYLYNFFTRISPEAIAIVVIPFFTLTIATWLTLWIVGPVGRMISEFIAYSVMGLYNLLNINLGGKPETFADLGSGTIGLGGALMGFTNPLWGLTGLHQGFTAAEATLLAQTGAQYGESFSFIGAVGPNCNVAMGASALAWCIVAKSDKEKGIALSGAASAELGGITEPAVYGINLDLRYPYLAAMLGGMVGGFWIASTGTYISSMGVGAWIGIVQFAPVPTDAFRQFCLDYGINGFFMEWSPMLKSFIGQVLAFTTAFTMTLVFSQTKWGATMHEERGAEVHQLFAKKAKASKEA